MNTYLQIIKATWAQYMIYRVNFMLWRLRTVMQLLVIYFLWWALFSQRQELFGYSEAMMLSYILLSAVVRTIVLGTTTAEIGDIINRGDLSNFLLKPVSFFRYFLARDIGDKTLNLVCSGFEITILFLLLRPPLVVQTNLPFVFLSVAAVGIGAVIYFCFSFILGLLGFWTPDIWAPRFLSFICIEFFSGALFPLDILPKPLFAVTSNLPFAFFLYFPLKVYLGQLSFPSIAQGFLVAVLWALGLWFIYRALWRKGLTVYAAEGR